MQYHDILFPYGKPEEKVSGDLLCDLRIDSVLLKLSNGPDQLKYDTCYLPLKDKESVLYRQAVFQDIMRFELYPVFMRFQEMMDSLNLLEEQINRFRLSVVRYRFVLSRMIDYKKTVLALFRALQAVSLQSEGLKQLRADLQEYISSEEFCGLVQETAELKQELGKITFYISVNDNHITIRKLPSGDIGMDGKTEFEREISNFFDQFISARASFSKRAKNSWELNPVEEQILKSITRLFPEPFSHLEKLVKRRSPFIPKELTAYHQVLGFYMVWLEYILPKQSGNLNFCFPMITERKDGFMASNCFDLILADQMLKEHSQVIRNNLILNPGEHILVLTGPNQGGKTTYARMLGQLFYLGSLGIPVPGTAVKMFLPDHIFTHFERQEDQKTLNGKLKDDIVRIHDIINRASENSLILINEMFSSTTLKDASWLGKKILSQIDRLGAFCLYVTFINELACYVPGTVSLVSEIGDDQEERTFEIVRALSDGRAYAHSMVKKYALTYDSISERIGSQS